MPLVPHSTYPGPPRYQLNGHFQTILPALTRKIQALHYQRERLELPDGDFVDLDWLDANSQDLVILSHGLEGSTERVYMKAAAHFFHQKGMDVLGWNCRSCSGEMNRKLRLYNHGEIGDFGQVIEHALQRKRYQKIHLIGYSMGGSILLKYLGVHGKNIPEAIKTGIAFSSPCDLQGSIQTLEKRSNWFYRRKFFSSLSKKIKAKAEQFPGQIDLSKFDQIKTWRDFDEFYSAPINGYRDAEDFYFQASAQNFVEGITVPALLCNAMNDPILTPSCSPKHLAKHHPYFYVETPRKGGHVGFAIRNYPGSDYWLEHRALEFIEAHN
jgi:uncharacterized protein